MDRRRFLRAVLASAAAACEPLTVNDPAAPPGAGAPSGPTDDGTAPARPPSPSPTPSPSPSPAPTSPEPSPADAAAAAATLRVLCRDAWGAAPPGEGFVEHTIRQLTVHHSAVVLGENRHAPARFRQHQQHHQQQGWPDIAYHLGVDRNGNVYDLRPARFRGDTFTAYDPAGHFLVLAEGNFDREQPTDAQLEGVATAFAWAVGAFGVAAATLTGHRDHAGTSCPGDALYARIGDLRARAEELARGEVTRHDHCGPEAAAYVQDVEAGRA